MAEDRRPQQLFFGGSGTGKEMGLCLRLASHSAAYQTIVCIDPQGSRYLHRLLSWLSNGPEGQKEAQP